MAKYVLYGLEGNKLVWCERFEAQDDEGAIRRSNLLQGHNAAELWCEGRRVRVFAVAAPSPLTASPSQLQLFKVGPVGLQHTLVLAADNDHAAQIFITVYVSRHGSMPGEFSVEHVTLRQVPHADPSLPVLVESGASGIVELRDGGWVLDAV